MKSAPARWFFPRMAVVLALVLAVIVFQPLFGQSASTGNSTTTTPSNAQQTLDLNQILQSIGGLGGLSQLTGNGGLTNNGITTGNGTTPTTSQPSTSGERQPAIISNQFSTTQGQSLQQRRPGLIVQQGIAEHLGQLDITGQEPKVRFWRDTAEKISLAVIDQIQGLLDTINTGISALSGIDVSGLGSSATDTTGDTTSTITNPATSGAGTSTPIE